jgi:hypothetical protein
MAKKHIIPLTLMTLIFSAYPEVFITIFGQAMSKPDLCRE